MNLSGFVPASVWVIYPSSGGLLMLEADTASVTSGAAYAQTATSFAVPEGYGLNLSGFNFLAGYVNDIAQFDATTGGNNNMSGILDENTSVKLSPNNNLTGNYTPDSPPTGRGSILVYTSGTYLGGLTLEYYTIDSSNALFIELDSGQSGQVSTGTFEGQNFRPRLESNSNRTSRSCTRPSDPKEPCGTRSRCSVG